MPEVIPFRAVEPAKLVRWTSEEITQIAQRAIKLLRDENKDPLDPKGFRRTIFEAQNVLPSHRHRGLESIQASKVEPYMDAVRQILRKEGEDRLAADEAKRKAAQAQAEQQAREQVEREAQARAQAEQQAQARAAQSQAQSTTNPLSQLHGTGPAAPAPQIGQHLQQPSQPFIPKQVQPDVPPEVAAALKGLTLETLVAFAGKMIGDALTESIMGAVNARFQAELPKIALRTQAITKTIPKILVVGPLPKQQPALEEAVEGLVDLKFVSSEEGPALIKLRGKSCVGAVLWTGFINHSHQAAVQKLFSSDSIRLVNGTNLDTVKHACEEIAVQVG